MLPQGCEQTAASVNQANTVISTSLNQMLATIPGTNTNQASINAAVSGLSEISQIVENTKDGKCGKALLETGDYIVAFTDTIMAITPMMMSFTNPSSLTYVMGAQVLSASVKTFVNYLNTLKVDMNTMHARQAFVENVCGYYQLNENLRSFIQLLKGQRTELGESIRRIKDEVDFLEKNEPKKPEMSPVFGPIENRYLRDRETFVELSQTLLRVQSKSFQCAVISSQIKDDSLSFPQDLILGVEYLLRDSAAQGRNTDSKELVVKAAKKVSKTQLDEGNSEICAKMAYEWMQTMEELLNVANQELALPGRRNLDASLLGKRRKEWEKLLGKKKTDLAELEARFTSLKLLSEKGMELELSELLDVRDKIRRQLFGDGKETVLFGVAHRQKPAESWLRHKWRSALVQIDDFNRIAPLISKNWLEASVTVFPSRKEKDYACSYVENAIMTFGTAEKHVEAAIMFCDSFSQTINHATHPYVSRYCLGKFDKLGHRERSGKLDLVMDKIHHSKPTVEKMKEWLSDTKCGIPMGLQELSL